MRVRTAEFDRTMRQYLEHSKRDWAQVFNTKGFFIARRATVTTKKASAAEIRKLRERAVIGTGTKNGKSRTIRDALANTRAAKILQARRRAEGKPAIPLKELPGAVRKFIAARLRSVGYIKSGNLPAIRILGPHADVRGSPRKDNTPKIFGRDKGGAKPARNYWRTFCQIFNAAITRRSGDAGLRKVGLAGLQSAFDFETQSMKDYIARKLRDRARRLAIRTR